MARPHDEAGVSLLESVMALAILSTGAISLLMAISLARHSAATQERSAHLVSVLASSTETVAAAPFVPCAPGGSAPVDAYRASLRAAGLDAADVEVTDVRSWERDAYLDAGSCPAVDAQQRVTLRMAGGRTIDLVKRAG
jgi:Tfp pilus assembly protein PilV